MSDPATMSSSWWAWPCLSLALGLISDPWRTALLVRCGLNRRPVVSRPLARRGAADPASLREGRLAVCSGQDLLARNPAPLAQPDRTCEAARPLPVPGRPHRRADRHGPEPLRKPRKEQTWPIPLPPIAPTHGSRNLAALPPSKWSASPAQTPPRRPRSPQASARQSSTAKASAAFTSG